MDLLPIITLNQLDDIDFRSWTRKQVIFKHSTRCFVSSTILKEVKAELEGAITTSDFEIYILDLIKFREISNAIADRYKVRHESPQLLIIDKAVCVFNASHSDVSLKDATLI